MQTKFTQTQLSNLFEASIEIFLKKETDNIMSGVSEINLCGRLALYLESNFPIYNIVGQYYADPEYNRKQNGEIKTIVDHNEKIIRISSDLLVHSRGTENPDNLITIEMKKSTRLKTKKTEDKNRLRAMTKKSDVWGWEGSSPKHVSGYILGIYIELDNIERTCSFEKYEDGELIKKWILPYGK